MRFQLGGAGKFVKIFEIGAANFIYFQKFPPLGRKFVKIYLPTHIWVGTGDFQKFPKRNAISVLKISEIGTDNFIYFQKFQIVFEICENIPSDHGSERAIFRNFRPRGGMRFQF
jgi:hypothetical protein